MKQCTSCGNEKSLDAFYPDSRYAQGVTSWCRECKSAYRHARYLANREVELQQAREWHAANPKPSKPRPTREERFWPKVDKDGPVSDHRPDLGPCWLWTAYVDERGYGIFRWESGRSEKAHRSAYLLSVGAIPDGLELDHLCKVRHCVRPTHLEPVTHVENIRRGDYSNNGARMRARTECPYGHPYDAENTMYKADGMRACRACKKAYSRAYYLRTRKAA